MPDDNRGHSLSPRSVPRSLLDKYAANGPRYTSYPTAPQFKTEFDKSEIERLWAETNASGGGLSLYLHVPFCKKRCLYCGCYTEIGHKREATDVYVEALLAEAKRLTSINSPSRPVMQLALGGGTPTFLSKERMASLVGGLREIYDFPISGERSIEIDPMSVDEEYLDLLLELGFNRMSFGLQDLNPEVQKAVGRVQSEEHIRGLLAHLRGRGFNAINLDLIYGLPLQTEKSFVETAEKIAEMRPSRVALFGYAHVPWVSPHQKALEKYPIPTAEERMRLFGLGFETLLAAGYRHVGMDHFALPEDELIAALDNRALTRNFMGYTTRRGLDLIGLGASSISGVGRTYAQNVKDSAAYAESAGAGVWTKALVLSDEDVLRREIIVDLFCNFRFDKKNVSERFGIDFDERFAAELEALKPMADDGLVEFGADFVGTTPLGRFFIRNVCMVFDKYLAEGKNLYSRTV